MRINITVFSLLLFFAISCRKDNDKQSPVIKINSPLQNSTVSAGNFIQLKATVTDDKKLDYVSFKLVSLDGNTQIADPINFSVSGKDLTIDQSVSVGDIHTTSGTYQIIIEAYDGTNKKKEYREIIVNEVARVLNKMVVVRKSGTGFAIDSLVGSTFVNFISRSTSFSSACLSNYYQQLYFAGKTDGVLEAYGLSSNAISWTLPADLPSTGIPLFYFNEYNSGELKLWQSFASTASGKLKVISNVGNVSKNYSMQSNQYAACLASTSSHIIVGEAPLIISGTSYLTYYFKDGFGMDFTTAMPFKPLKLFVLSSNELVVIGNNGNQGELRIYDSNTNGFWEQVHIPLGTIYDAVQLNTNEYIIAHESGLLKFQHSPTNLINLTTGNKAQILTLDNFTGTLYAGEGNLVKVYDPVSGLLAGTYVSADSVRGILFHYNK